jgi:hypothetical protein
VPIAGWANESFQVTRRKSVQYCVRVSSKCFYQQGNETFSEGAAEKVVIVNAAYLELHVPLVRDRLKRAGIRLGNLLDTTLGAVVGGARQEGLASRNARDSSAPKWAQIDPGIRRACGLTGGIEAAVAPEAPVSQSK